jgi:FkbM family methyltransferase
MSIAQFTKRMLRRLGLVVHRWPITRFDGMADGLELLRNAGFRPDLVIDVGANRGTWAALACAHWPDAVFHLIEPQPGCLPSLRDFVRNAKRAHIHSIAVTSPGVSQVAMAGGGDSRDGTGNFIAPTTEPDTVPYPATTLDQLLSSTGATSILLKLDVDGHELSVLEGARSVLRHTEVVIAEFWMFKIFDQEMAVLPDLIRWLGDAGFELYDFASLNGRRRDQRLRSGDAVFVRRGSALLRDVNWQ